MVREQLLRQIKEDLSTLVQDKEILGILLFGSYLDGLETNRSDIDICIVAPNEENAELLPFIWKNINVNLKKI
jgi:predicted nucleotidyltransferase